jgi:peptidoglycan/LPS O-acetylase OafA/YrhL
VAAVLVHHHDPDLLPGGFLGVSLFFTLSGFLITTLLLREHDATGTIGFRRFWARRLRRLTPVALLGLVLALGVAAIDEPRESLAETGGDVVAAALDVANWRLASDDVDYGDTLRPPSPVAHYWSLAIEEQFYAVFPIVALVALRRGGRRALGGALVAALALSLLAQQFVGDANRAYLGTDSRLGELAVGALLAVGWQGWRSARDGGGRWAGAARLDLAAACAAVALVVSWRRVELGDPRLFDGGLVLHAALAAVVVAAAVAGRWAPALGRFGPLVWLGKVSYAAYVVHFPLYLWLDDAGFAVRLALTLVVAAGVNVLVERPVRFGGALRAGRQAPLAAMSALGAVLLLAVAVPEAAARRDVGATVVAADRPTVVTMPVTSTTTTAPPSSTTAGPATEPVAAAVGGVATAASVPAGAAAPAPPPATVPARVPRLLVVGDSTALATGEGMQRWAAESGRAIVDVVGHYGCTFLQDGRLRVRDGWTQTVSPQCLSLLDVVEETAAATRPDAVVLFLGVIQLSDWDLDDDGTWRTFGDPVFDARYVAAVGAALDRLAALGVPILWADHPTPDWDPETTGPLPGAGEPVINDPARLPRMNVLTDAAVAGRPSVRIVPYARHLAGPDGRIPTDVRPDGLHVAAAAVPGVMAAGFESELAAAYRALAAPGAPRTAWSAA